MRTWPQHIPVWWQALVYPARAGQLVLERDGPPGFDRFLTVGVAVLYAIYGLSMGLSRGYVPAAVSGLKLPFLYLFTLAVCFPPFYVLNALAGPRLTRRCCLRLLLIATSANAIALASYAPVSYFFTLTTTTTALSGYRFVVLMHVVVFAFAGMVSIAVIVVVFRATGAALGRAIRPSFLLTCALIYAFVGTQMSWVLRPWIGSWAVEYQPLRKLEGSFIEAVWRLISEIVVF